MILYNENSKNLGNNLLFSTLPELCYENDKKFYISSLNSYSNNEIYDLVWGSNPYVIGKSDDNNYDAGLHIYSTLNINSRKYEPKPDNYNNIIEKIEYHHGFIPKNNKPKIYYKPKYIKAFSEYNVYDFGSLTAQNRYTINDINFILNNNDNKHKLIIKSKNINTLKFNKTNNILEYNINNIFEFVDIIYSCKLFSCLHSGSSVLSSAIKYSTNKDINIKTYLFKNYDDWLQNESDCWEDKYWIFDNIKYIKL